jgi:hypothetical protein
MSPFSGLRINHAFIKELKDSGAIEKVIGFNTDGYVPVKMFPLLTQAWDRSFEIVIGQQLEDLRDTLNDKDTLSNTNKNVLRKKYLEQDPCLQALAITDPDHLLHLIYTQPWRLFGITPKKHLQLSVEEQLRCWILDIPGNDNRFIDIAPYIRTHIRHKLARELGDSPPADLPTMAMLDYQPPHSSPSLSPSAISGNSKGFYHLSFDNPRLIQFINLQYYLSHYSIGRLLFGQNADDIHHIAAKEQSKTKVGYTFYWLLAHLNLHFIKAWIIMIASLLKNQWKVFKEYIEGKRGFTSLCKHGLFFILTAFLCVFAPLMVILPIIWGITTIPFTLLRSLCLYSNISFLRHYVILKCLDCIDFIKDVLLFFLLGLGIVSFIANIALAILPTWILFPSALIVFIPLLIVSILCLETSNDITNHAIVDLTWSIASTQAMRLTGFLSFISLSLYIVFAVLLEKTKALLPNRLKHFFFHIISRTEHFFLSIENWFNRRFSQNKTQVATQELKELNKNLKAEKTKWVTQQADPLEDQKMALRNTVTSIIASKPPSAALFRKRDDLLCIIHQATPETIITAQREVAQFH